MRKYFLLGTQRIMERIEPPTVTVTFDDNLANYYMEGETWGTVESVPSAVVMAGQVLSSDVVPERVTASYTLDSQTYTAFNTNDMWYRDSACTQKFNFGVDVITEDTTLYRKWGCNSKTISRNSVGSMTFTLPKFVDTISGYCIGGGGASGQNTFGIRDDYFEIGIAGGGRNGTANSFSATAVTGGVPVTLYAGAGGTSTGAGTASYININGTRKISGAGGAGGASNNKRFNLSEWEDGHEITGSTYTIGEYIGRGNSAGTKPKYTNLVSGASVLGNVSFQIYGSAGTIYAGGNDGFNSGATYFRVMLDGAVKYTGSAGSYSYKWNERFSEWVESGTDGAHINDYHLGTASTYGQGGFGGFCCSNATGSAAIFKVSSQAGYRGRAYVTVSGG